jgi:hypothetical protein
MLYFSSSLLIQWAASKFADATFVTYEQMYPDDGFGVVMQKHFESMSSPLLSLAKFPDLESQEHRYVSQVCIAFSGSVQHKKKSWSKLKFSAKLYMAIESQFNILQFEVLFHVAFSFIDLCGLVVRVPGCRSRDPGFDSWRYQIF